MVGHRANLAGSLYKGCQAEPNIKFHFAHSITEVKTFFPKPKFTILPRNVTPFDVESDILLASDGIKSTVRTNMLAELNVHSNIEDTGQAAYRIMLPREKILNDPELLQL